jgi:hypothetical protein
MLSTILLFLVSLTVGFFSLNCFGERTLLVFIISYVMPVISVGLGFGFSANVLGYWSSPEIFSGNWLMVALGAIAFVPGLMGVWLGYWATQFLDRCRIENEIRNKIFMERDV